MFRSFVPALSLSVFCAGTASAQSADQIKVAAESFDSARKAFRAERFDEAAEHFEAADAEVPTGRSLFLAMEARDRAGQADRAATLAALLVARHAEENDAMAAQAAEYVESAKPNFLALEVRCSPACEVVVGTRVVHGGSRETHSIFLAPGDHRVRASWDRSRNQEEVVSGEAGGSTELVMEAPPPEFSDRRVGPVATPLPRQLPAPGESSTGLPQGVFWSGVGLTAVAGSVGAWSYMDAVNEPGTAKVKRECAGKALETCESYLEGQDKENRTNVILAVAGGLGVTTAVVGLFFTDWDSEDEFIDEKPEHVVTISPHVDIIDGAIVGAKGTFF